MDWKNKNVLVFGSGKSGVGAAGLLQKLGACPVIFDSNPELDRQKVLDQLEAPAEICLGQVPEEQMDALDLVVMSPGVPCDQPLVEEFRARKIPVWGEVELAYRLGKGRVLAITGTNGKTTSTALLGEIMKAACPEVYVVGNIGNPYTGVVLDQSEKAVTVAEISSFQLETIEAFHPSVSAITNITEDHLNRHHTMEEYIRVKERITENQTEEEVCVLNYEDPVLRAFGETLTCRAVYFSSRRSLKQGICLEGDAIVLRDGEKEIEIVRTGDLKLLGLHNYENVMTAAAMAYYAGVPAEVIRRAACAFAGVEHRIEYVADKNGVKYYNDSKGTNPDAAIKGIQAMVRPTLLIGGGYDKQSTYGEWIDSFEGKVKYLVLIGATREKIAREALEHGFPEERILFCGDLAEAVKTCAAHAEEGDAVLLSPACASWDQFKSYEERGDLFKEYVRAL